MLSRAAFSRLLRQNAPATSLMRRMRRTAPPPTITLLTPCTVWSSRYQSSCPFSSPTPTATATGTTTATPTATCPIMGTPVTMNCPVEEDQDVKMRTGEVVNALGKAKLSMFVTATATCGYVLAGGTNPLVAIAVTAGTYLQSLSACTANQIVEMQHDKKMKRTCRRLLPSGRVAVPTAVGLSVAEGIAGTAVLAAVSPLAAGLGALNWVLYVGMYTPLKRISAVNTWYGALVGGLPPLMGGAAAAHTIAWAPYIAGVPTMGPAYLLGAFMLAWQIPHFMALSFHCRRDYEAAGFKMLAFSNPWRASMWAIVISVAMAVITLAGPAFVEWPVELWYYPTVLAANVGMIHKSVRFHMDPMRNCRGCFVFSYLYLGIMLAAMTINYFQPVTTSIAIAEGLMEMYNNRHKAEDSSSEAATAPGSE